MGTKMTHTARTEHTNAVRRAIFHDTRGAVFAVPSAPAGVALFCSNTLSTARQHAARETRVIRYLPSLCQDRTLTIELIDEEMVKTLTLELLVQDDNDERQRFNLPRLQRLNIASF